MTLTEWDRLNRELRMLIFTRNELGKIREAAKGKRPTPTMVRFRVSRMISDVDRWIADKKKELADEEIRERLERLEEKHDEATLGTAGAEAGGEADPGDAAEGDGRHEVHLQHEQQRAAAGAGRGDHAQQDPAVRGLAAGKIEGTAEEILRTRHREKRLRDWQTEIMEADREGRHERMVL